MWTFFEDSQNRNLIKKMSELLGQIRKVESYHQRRFYVPKVIAGETIKTDNEPTIMAEVS